MEESNGSLPLSPTDSRQTADLQQTGCSLRTRKLQRSARAETAQQNVRHVRWQALQDLTQECDERNAPSLKTRRPFGGRIRPAVAGCTFRILVFLNSTTAQKSDSLQLTELQTVYILFIYTFYYLKLLQNKLKWSMKVTRTAVTSVTRSRERKNDWSRRIFYLFLPQLCVFFLMNHQKSFTKRQERVSLFWTIMRKVVNRAWQLHHVAMIKHCLCCLFDRLYVFSKVQLLLYLQLLQMVKWRNN